MRASPRVQKQVSSYNGSIIFQSKSILDGERESHLGNHVQRVRSLAAALCPANGHLVACCPANGHLETGGKKHDTCPTLVPLHCNTPRVHGIDLAGELRYMVDL